ncbi:hypothetical protein CC86DRAFT_411576 [Ophiobolus disseminans]|uniref:F-box domain-containing protein n=1 Tax=Ophiobolus disseminans TaxID=1469910 RepID=A0A6A6ZK66_9PLEO|nr:hypothetical protein CC86DRAFT_411576 [Ophiobolus disseminans]
MTLEGENTDQSQMATEMRAITARNQRESPLLRLPAELRNRIYRFALHAGVTYPQKDPRPPYNYFLLMDVPSNEVPRLLSAAHTLPHASYQIHKETTVLKYTFHIFNMTFGDLIRIHANKMPVQICCGITVLRIIIWRDDIFGEQLERLKRFTGLKKVILRPMFYQGHSKPQEFKDMAKKWASLDIEVEMIVRPNC